MSIRSIPFVRVPWTGIPRRRLAVAALLASVLAPHGNVHGQSQADGERPEPRVAESRTAEARGAEEAARPNDTQALSRAERQTWVPLRGVTMGASMTSDLTEYWNPLVRQPTARARARALSVMSVRADLDSAVHWSGLTVMLSGMSLQGEDQTAALGAANGGTSIDALPFQALGEAWAEQRLAGGKLRLKAGRMDANSEFAMSINAQGFLRPGAGLDPTMAVVMPTYPLPATGVNVFVQVSPRVQLSGGLYDGRPAAAVALGATGEAPSRARFGIAELDVHGERARVVVGAWRHTSDFSSLLMSRPERRRPGLSGVYAVADQRVAAFGNGGDRTLNAFAQFGLSDRRLSDVHRHASVGLLAQGASAYRPADQLGVSLSVLAVGEVGANVRGATNGAREAHLELFYAAVLAPWLTAEPDLQFVPKPVGRKDGRTGTAFTLRFIVTR